MNQIIKRLIQPVSMNQIIKYYLLRNHTEKTFLIITNITIYFKFGSNNLQKAMQLITLMKLGQTNITEVLVSRLQNM